MGQELWQREGEHEQCQEYDEVFIRLYHFTERYLDKLGDAECQRNEKLLEKHIECIQEYYQIKKS